MATRKLTAEEAAAAEAGAEQQQAATAAGASTGASVRLATHPFHASFAVGDVTITPDGVEVDAATAEQVRAAAVNSGVTLREL